MLHLPQRPVPGQSPAGQPAIPQGEKNDVTGTAEVTGTHSFSALPECNSSPSTPAEPRQPCPTPQQEDCLCRAGVMHHRDVPRGCATGAAPVAARGQLSLPVRPRGPDGATWPRDCPGRRPPIESHRLSLPACRLQQDQAAALTFFIPSCGRAALQVRIDEWKLIRWSPNLHLPADFQARLHPALPVPVTSAVSEQGQSLLLGGGWRAATW